MNTRQCEWCGRDIPADRRPDAKYDKPGCRVSACRRRNANAFKARRGSAPPASGSGGRRKDQPGALPGAATDPAMLAGDTIPVETVAV